MTIVDLDTVNPYFRTNDAKSILDKSGIRLIASQFAGTNLDIPTVPPDVTGVFEDKSRTVIFDIGGDEDGAYVLGQYKRFFAAEGSIGMHLVINTKRILSSSADETVNTARRIESASRLKFTDIYNNTNLGNETDENTLMSDIDIINKISDAMDIPIAKHCGIKRALKNLNGSVPVMEIDIKLKMPWEN